MKADLIAPFALAVATLGLAACGNHQQGSKAQQSSGPAQGVSVSDGRLVLPAVHGNPGAVYFTVHNDTNGPATLDGAEVDGAKMAMLHAMSMVDGHTNMQEVNKMDVPAGGELVFAPGGRHVMAMDLDDSLKPGGTTNVTLSFASGAKATFPAEILAAGNAH
ncbi:MAG TPA: copper chaperone PCu(A)C [Croceibacterium sp.]